ncbi:AMP-binding protein [Ornithinimicrobium murale]|uniref:AMP-binding protein n=1 Tax=Ornithinimicrobium murale TaxID=1050153 RepID=UPI0013B3864B|nr:AMP-binding protein [Ornithinimicrobium murale]
MTPNSGTVLSGLLREQARKRTNAEYVRFLGGRAATFGETDSEVDALAAWLTKREVRSGDRVAILLPNRFEFLVTWFATNRLGAIEVPLNVYLRGAALAHQLTLTTPRVLVTDLAGWQAVLAAGTEFPPTDVLLVDEGGPSNTMAYAEAVAWGRNQGQRQEQSSFSETAAILFTSGTTGRPKGVMASHQYIRTTAENWVRHTECTSTDTLFNPLPLFHVNAQFLTAIPPLITGCRAVLASTFSASAFWSQVSDNDVTIFNYHSSVLAILLRTWPSTVPQHSLRLGMGAGAAERDWLEFEERTGVPLVEAYGLTECATVTAMDLRTRRPGSCGLPVNGYDVRVVDENDAELPAGEVGQIVVRPRSAFLGFSGYWGDPSATVKACRNFWFHTGDLGSMDGDDYLRFVDRRSDAIRRRGENISSTEVEAAVREYPGVVDCAVVAVPSELGEDEVMVVVEHHRGGAPRPAELLRYLYPRLPYFAVPRYILTTEDLPRNASRRVLKAGLRSAKVRAAAWDGGAVLAEMEQTVGRR